MFNPDPEGLLKNANAASVFADRWSRRSLETGQPTETYLQACDRVASTIVSAAHETEDSDALYEDFMALLTTRRFLPNSPCWTGAGTPLGQLAACFVLPVGDSMPSIMQTLFDAAMIQKTGGGNGFSFTNLRGKGTRVASSAGVSSGPVAFIEAYDAVFGKIMQGGARRGANMGVMRIDHPDIEEFIKCKTTEGNVSQFNISVALTDDFMQRYEDGDPEARRLMRLISEGAHRNGEPGVLFIDQANRTNPVPHRYELEATNPCGEQWLGPYENCCLGSVNLAEHLTLDDDGKPCLDLDLLEKTVTSATVFLDLMVSANKYVPEVPKLRAAAMDCRRIGLGIMGLHDVLMALQFPYDSPSGRAIASDIMRRVRNATVAASIQRAKEHGPYPALDSPEAMESAVSCARASGVSEENIANLRKYGIRNAAQNTIAPTGTLSTVSGCEGYGCEPVFALSHVRWVVDPMAEGGRRSMNYVSDYFLQYLEERFADDPITKQIVLDHMEESGGSIEALTELFTEHERAVFRTACDMTAESHVEMQIALQRFVDNSISKTINMPESATVDDVEDAYVSAWRGRCKGLTVYRTNSRQVVVLESKKKIPETTMTTTTTTTKRITRPQTLKGETMAVSTPVGEVYVTINHSDEDGEPFEVFVQAAKAGSETAAHTEAMGRLISYILRMPLGDGHATPKERLSVVQQQLSGIGGGRSVGLGPKKVRSLPDGLSHMFRVYLESSSDNNEEEETLIPPPSPQSHPIGDLCPDCGNPSYVRTEGCLRCLHCGRSEC